MQAVVFDQHGGNEVLSYREVDTPEPGPGEVRVAVEACSLNYHDVFTRNGMPGIKTPLPMIPGCDAAGRVDLVADDVDGWTAGDRVLVDPVEQSPDGKIRMIGDTRWGGYADSLSRPSLRWWSRCLPRGTSDRWSRPNATLWWCWALDSCAGWRRCATVWIPCSWRW